MLIKNCKIIFTDRIEDGILEIQNNIITGIYSPHSNLYGSDVIDAEGAYLSPGFIDLHIHGAGGCDTMDGNYDALNKISKIAAQHGTTSFLPTTMTCSIDEIQSAVEAAAFARKQGTDGASILGIHLEGPFLNPEMCGAQNKDYMLAPSIEVFKSIVGDYLDTISTVTIAPELEGAKELVRYLRDLGIVVSIGHSKASYEGAIQSFNWGISHSTHLYNAMTGMHHREAGVVGAVLDSDITTEIIADGVHVNYPVLRVTCRAKGTDKTILITDAMMACGMAEGKYSLGGQDVLVKDGAARLESGTLAGSVLTLDKAVKNLYKNSSIPLYEIINMVSFNPATLLKISNQIGQIKIGLDADLVIFDEDINIQSVIIKGKMVPGTPKLP
jgi:N-acetylglucosamine-6-phosphate deacetylase